MGNLAEHSTSDSPETAEDAALAARAQMLRAALGSIPENQRAAVLAQIRDIIPASFFHPQRAPQRGGDVLNNVFALFRENPEAEHDTATVMAELTIKGKKYEPQRVRLALNYLNSRRIIQRIGYGKYRLENGDIVDGLP